MNWFTCTPLEQDPYERLWINLDQVLTMRVHFTGDHVEVKIRCTADMLRSIKLTNREYAELVMQMRGLSPIQTAPAAPSNE